MLLPRSCTSELRDNGDGDLFSILEQVLKAFTLGLEVKSKKQKPRRKKAIAIEKKNEVGGKGSDSDRLARLTGLIGKPLNNLLKLGSRNCTSKKSMSSPGGDISPHSGLREMQWKDCKP